ncbi:MAG: nucleotidyltransferase domain-containing protein [Rhodocyclaceae bacterium]|nr:nucleotidyltransferase domain-containing protein [Rhodocyclaceae bacterium]
MTEQTLHFSHEAFSEQLRIIAQIAAERIQQRFPGCEVRLFGSVAKGRASASSDIDLAVFLDIEGAQRRVWSGRIQRELLDLVRQYLVSFDVVVFDKKQSHVNRDDCSSTLLREVLFHE